jgi:predicted DNA-binding transcriptional regulator AlpA
MATLTEVKTQDTTEGYITKPEVAQRMQKTPRTIERWMIDGILPYIKIGKGKRASVLFRWSDIQAHFEAKFAVRGRRAA